MNGIGGWLRLRGTRAPGVVSPAVMARTTGAFFTFGGVFGLAQTAVMPVDMRGSRLVCGLLAAACLVMGIVILALGDRIPVRQQQWLLFSPTPFVAAGVWESTSNIAAIGVAGFFVTVTCTGAFFLSWPAASANTVIGVVCCMTTLGLRPGLQWWAGLVTSGVVIAVFFVVGVLMRVASEADVDPLTGLLNRRGFARQLELEIARATKSRAALALILVDLDRFKDINDESGHAAGDIILQEVADTWRKMMGTNAILARFGGDEFTLLLPGCCERDAVRVAESMRNAISVGCSAGITAWHLGESASFMVSRADVGLYRAKETGRNRSVVETSHQPLLAAELVEAIESDKLDVAFQPIVAIDAGASVIGFEALLRWCSATQKGVTPAEIIRVAEECDLISSLGRQVLATACRQAVVLQRLYTDRALMLSVNVSGLELIRADYVRSVEEVLRETRWPSKQLVLEVTESVLDLDARTTYANLKEIRAQGVRIAIDDFGTGYSSLSRLASLPTDILKLDASFVAAVQADSPPPPLLSVIAKLSEKLGLPVIIEGVENAEQAAVLEPLGFTLAQGFYYGRPQEMDILVAATDAARRADTRR